VTEHLMAQSGTDLKMAKLKGDPDNFLHLFEGVIRMQKWLMPVACHMFTYTLKDSTCIWWNSQKACIILNYEDLKAKFQSHFSRQKKFTKIHLAVHNIKQREGESTRAFITRYTDDTLQILGLHEEQRIYGFIHGLRTRTREVVTNGVLNNRRDDYERSKKFSWGNNIGKKDRGRFSPYKGQNHKLLSNLVKIPKEILTTEKVAKTFKQPPQLPEANWSKHKTRYCNFHEDYGHETNQCQELKHQIEEAVKSRQLAHLVKGVKEKKEKTNNHSEIEEITFPPLLNVGLADPVIIKVCISRRQVNRVYLDRGSSCEVLYEHCFLKLKPLIRSLRVDSNTLLVRFSGEQSWPLGEIPLEITIGDGPFAITKTLTFIIVKSDSLHNLLLGRTAMQQMGIVKPKEEEGGSTNKHQGNEESVLSYIDTEERVVINDKYSEQKITIGRHLPTRIKIRLRDLLKKYIDVFAWTSAHITGVPRGDPQPGRRLDRTNKVKEDKPSPRKKPSDLQPGRRLDRSGDLTRSEVLDMGIKSRGCDKRQRKMEAACRLHKHKQSMHKRASPITRS
ncbi:reverse transcriptase domain-containing protein, partial [Tanacetum coccineum]